MLQILTNGTALDLPTDIAINMTMENPFMLEDRVPTPYSLTFELPPTPRNLQLFGYPDRIGSYTSGNSYNRSIEVVIRFNGLLIAAGALILTEYDRTLKVNFSGVDFNRKLKDKMFEVPMDTIQIGGTYNVAEWDNPSNYANIYRQWAKTNRYDDISGSDPRFVIAPIIRSTSDTPFSWWEHRRGGGVKIARRSVKRSLIEMFYNGFSPANQEFFFIHPETPEVAHSPILPQLRVWYLFEEIFGDDLEENPFLSADLVNLVVPSYYHPHLRTVSNSLPLVSNLAPPSYLYPSGSPFIKLDEYLPNVDVNVFTREMVKLFCYTLYRYRNSYRIVSNTDILARSVEKDWSAHRMETFGISVVPGQFYDYGYSNDKPRYEGRADVTVATLNAMMRTAAPLNDDDEYSRVFYVTETKQFFERFAYLEEYKKGSTTHQERIEGYTLLGYDLPELDSSGEEKKYNARAEINLPDMHPTVYFNTLANLENDKFWLAAPKHSPTLQAPAANRLPTATREGSIDLLMFDGAKQVASESLEGYHTYPYLSSYGNSNLSLFWDGPNGLLEKFHNPFKAWIEKPKLKLSAQVLLNALDYHQLDITEKIHIDGRNFFIEKIQFTIRPNKIEPAQIDFIEA